MSSLWSSESFYILPYKYIILHKISPKYIEFTLVMVFSYTEKKNISNLISINIQNSNNNNNTDNK